MSTIETWVERRGGVVGIADLAEYLDVSESELRQWAEDYGAPKVGRAYALDVEAAQDAADDLLGDDEEEDEEGEEGEDDEEAAASATIEVAAEEQDDDDLDDDDDDEASEED